MDDLRRAAPLFLLTSRRLYSAICLRARTQASQALLTPSSRTVGPWMAVVGEGGPLLTGGSLGHAAGICVAASPPGAQRSESMAVRCGMAEALRAGLALRVAARWHGVGGERSPVACGQRKRQGLADDPWRMVMPHLAQR